MFKPKIKKTKNNLFELEESVSRFKKYKNRDYDDPEYREIRDMGNLFNQSINEDYCKPVRTVDTFNNKNNYFEYESKGDKDKSLSPKEYLNMIKPYLSDIKNDNKTPKKLRVNSGNKVTDYETQYKDWKIQLIMKIVFVFSIDSNVSTKSDNIEIMMGC